MPYQGVVQKIIPDGKHGPYVVITVKEFVSDENPRGNVTSSLTQPVWQEKRFPKPGECVLVDDVTEKTNGLRAGSVRFLRPEDKTATSNEQTAKAALTMMIARWKEMLFPATDDPIWASWVNFKKNIHDHREWCDLESMVKGDFRDGFKARVLTIMLLPELRWNPFPWTDRDRDSYAHFGWDIKLQHLSRPVLAYTADLVTTLITHGHDFIDKKRNDRVVQCADTYNACIMELMATPLDDTRKRQLMDAFSLRDHGEWDSDTGPGSGYNPFLAFMQHTGILENWKRLLDQKMRLRTQAEVAGIERPRNDGKRALYWYNNLFRYTLARLPYSQELFRDQVRFLVSLPNTTKYPFVESHLLQGVLSGIGDDKNLRHAVTRNVLLHRVEDPDWHFYGELPFAKKLLAEFGDDPELARCLRGVVAEKAQNATCAAVADTLNRKSMETIISCMR